MAKGIGNGVQKVPSIWGPLTVEQIAAAEAAALAKAQDEARKNGAEVPETFWDLTPAERRAARAEALDGH